MSISGLIEENIELSNIHLAVLLKLEQIKSSVIYLPVFTSQKTLTGGNPENGPSGLI